MKRIVWTQWLRGASLAAAASAFALLGGCVTAPSGEPTQAVPTLSAQVSAYHQWSATQAKVYRFAPVPNASLEQQTLQATLAASLARAGFVQSDAATLSLEWSATIKPTTVRVADYIRYPYNYWGEWGYRGWGRPYGRPYGYGYGAGFGGFGAYGGPWGVAPLGTLIPVERTVDAFERQLMLTFKQAGGAVAYEGRLTSVGNTGALNEVMPFLTDAMMQRFPGDHAKTWVVKVPMIPAKP